MKKLFIWLLITVFSISFILLGISCGEKVTTAEEEVAEEEVTKKPSVEKLESPEFQDRKVKIGIGPYFTNSALIIGIEKGWYDELGITFLPEPYGIVVPGVDQVNYLASEEADMTNQPSILYLSAIKDLPPVKTFVYQTMFCGYCIIGRSEDKSIGDFKAEGLGHQEALKATIEQLEGKRFGHTGCAGSISFIKTLLTMSDMTLDDLSVFAFADPEIIAMFLTEELDYTGGLGLPAAMELLKKGGKLLISTKDVAVNAEATPDSVELRTIFPVGWTTYDEFIDKEGNYDLMLRLSSVVWREARFINENRDEAIELHLPFLNTIAGSENTVEDITLAYDYFDPFYDFEEQEKWFTDPDYSLYQDHVLGAYIKQWTEEGYLEEGEVEVSDISIAKDLYLDMLDLKEESSTMISEAENSIEDAKDEANVDNDLLDQASSLLEESRYFFENYNYIDANRFAEVAKNWAECAISQ